MPKYTFTAILSAGTIAFSLCGCNEKTSSNTKSPAPQPTTTAVIQHDDTTSFDNGSYSGTGFSLYADPRIWAFKEKKDDICDLRMITDKDIVSCGVSVYISDDDHDGKTAQEIVDEQSKNDNIVYTGPLATSSFTFYFYEWEKDENTRARTYLADHGDKYICVYAESSNFNFVDVKIADLLSTLKITDETEKK